MDMVCALIAFLILYIVMLLLALLVKKNLGSPVLFKQKRIGKDERVFTLYKFRTMKEERDKNGTFLTEEERLTRFGRFLRSTSLDELPELLNIFKGDMSFIGPRPLLTRYLPFYTEEERKRHSVRPGLSGLAQIKGRNAVGWSQRFQYDLDYVNNITFIKDVKLFVLSIITAIRRNNVLIGSTKIIEDLDIERGGEMKPNCKQEEVNKEQISNIKNKS
jgi:lipopolysaccharide/colanic/teichoic acid biosynthesis glycosyltransferase